MLIVATDVQPGQRSRLESRLKLRLVSAEGDAELSGGRAPQWVLQRSVPKGRCLQSTSGAGAEIGWRHLFAAVGLVALSATAATAAAATAAAAAAGYRASANRTALKRRLLSGQGMMRLASRRGLDWSYARGHPPFHVHLSPKSLDAKVSSLLCTVRG